MARRTVRPGVVGGEPPDGFPLQVRAHGFVLTDGLRAYAREHVAAKLAKHARRIQAVTIRFHDVNGTKGGVDKRCRIEVVLPRRGAIVTEEANPDLRAAMDRAADRTQVAVTREIGRRRQTPRQRGRKMVRDRKTISG
jgi:ribosome-associated translation inhibitor RaiA